MSDPTSPHSAEQCALFLIDASGCVASWNDVAAFVTGYSAERLLGRSFTLMCEPGAHAFQAALTEARDTGYARCLAGIWHGSGNACAAVLQLARIGSGDEPHGEFICSLRVEARAHASASEATRADVLSDAPLGAAVRYAARALDEIASLRAIIGDLKENLALLAAPNTPPDDADG